MSEAAPVNHYGEELADLYDYSPLLADGMDNPALEYFSALADKYGGPVLQIGVATGQFVLPIIRGGHDFVGIDLSESMLERVRTRVAQEPTEVQARLDLHIADMRDLDLDRRFPLIIMPGNVFLYNLTQRDQLATLTAMSRHLAADGVLAIEIFTIAQRYLAATSPLVEQYRFRTDAGLEYLAENAVTVDLLNQLETLHMTHRRLCADGRLGTALFNELVMRYVQPAEMLLLLRLAGLRPREFGGDYVQGHRKSSYEGPQLIIASRSE